MIVPKAGRYKTTGASFCLPATLKGLLKPCGPETSLEAGPTVFDATPALAEVPLKVDKPDSMPLPLSKAPYLQDGQDRYTTEIRADEMKMLGSRQGMAGSDAPSRNEHSFGGAPSGGAGPRDSGGRDGGGYGGGRDSGYGGGAPAPASAPAPKKPAAGGFGDFDDDIPF